MSDQRSPLVSDRPGPTSGTPPPDAVHRARPQERRCRRHLGRDRRAQRPGLRSRSRRGRHHRAARAGRAPRRRGQDPHPDGEPAARAAHPAAPRRGAPATRPPTPPRSCCAPSARARPGRARCGGWPPSSSPRSATWTGASPPPTPRSAAAVADSGTTLTELRGIGDLTAGKILARVGDISRFRSAAAFASYTGTAPIEVSSGDVVRHRLSRAGDRQLNCCLHTMAITQIRHDSPGRAYYQRKRAAGKSHKEALRCLKRRLSDVVYRRLCPRRGNPAGDEPGRTPGATTKSSAAGSTPTAGSSDKSLPGPASTDSTTLDARST